MTIAKTMIDTKEIDFDRLDKVAGERSSYESIQYEP